MCVVFGPPPPDPAPKRVRWYHRAICKVRDHQYVTMWAGTSSQSTGEHPLEFMICSRCEVDAYKIPEEV